MKINRFLLLTAGLSLAITFTLSCSSGDDNGSGGISSSSSGSGGGSTDNCSLELPPVAFPCNEEEVAIGNQIWSKCNLNVVPNAGNHSCYCDKPENCEKYGRLYDWTTAMALDTSCNSTSCASQINSPHQGICPTGWHIPNDDEWIRMSDYAFTDKGSLGVNRKDLRLVGGYYKATSGWNWNEYNDKGGTDDYGFSALPGGYGNVGSILFGGIQRDADSFVGAGDGGYWWSASEKEECGKGFTFIADSAVCANNVSIGSDISNLYPGFYGWVQNKGYRMYSVRCVKDRSCAGFVEGTEREHYGRSKPQFCDSRDGKKYVYVSIGEQTWMAENLDYSAKDSECHPKCSKYGRHYHLETAMTACPSGWHLPSAAEWTRLTNFVGSSTAGTKLKAASDWDINDSIPLGTDDYGFSALPGGYAYPAQSDGNYRNYDGKDGSWWSADSSDFYRRMRYDGVNVTKDGSINKNTYLFSVRCVKD